MPSDVSQGKPSPDGGVAGCTIAGRRVSAKRLPAMAVGLNDDVPG